MPYAAVSWIPRARAAWYNERLSALPPMMIFQPPKSWPWEVGQLSSICRMVGTQWEKVTFSSRHSLTSMSGS
ncbi:hypothetical protein D3C77_640420 [compost metagenome]